MHMRALGLLFSDIDGIFLGYLFISLDFKDVPR